MIRVLVADDQSLFRMGLRVLLESEGDMELVGEAGDGRAAVEMARRTRPDVALLDVRMPDTDGLAALRGITEDPGLSGTRVVMLTTFDLDEYVFEALRGGASGFLVKDTEPDELVRAVRVVARGESLLSPTVTRRLISAFVARTALGRVPHPGLARLTERERQIVALVAEGLSNEEIADRLVISPATARTHVSRAMVKLHARDRAQLVVFAFQSDLARGQSG
ncbi:MAG: two component transcriptional regulator, LuxR family [Streptosporangiaceae bacterium]|jgi:DNA-binding NarL/FixJ family response regulator|nr:two component transcriptional regulator, LuxR family [Streptosporangiaceae bacterium]